MQAVTAIGLDIAKSVFQVHGIDAAGQVVIRRKLKRRYLLMFFQKLPPCLVGIEACASSHYWSRELAALGHTVRWHPEAAHEFDGPRPDQKWLKSLARANQSCSFRIRGLRRARACILPRNTASS
jgi:transposase